MSIFFILLERKKYILYVQQNRVALGFIWFNTYFCCLNRKCACFVIFLMNHLFSFTEWVQMAPTLFSKFIPNILPPTVESELSEYAAQDQKLQRELIQNGFTRQVAFFFSDNFPFP